MTKYYGAIGYGIPTEITPGVWQDTITEYNYMGDVSKIARRYQTTDKVNDDLTINNEISIVSDPFALRNFGYIKYAVWAGMYWKVTNVTVEYPRLVLTVGGVYNGPRATSQTPSGAS